MVTTKLIDAEDLRLCHTVIRLIPGFGEKPCDVISIRRLGDDIQVWVDTGYGEERLCLRPDTTLEVVRLHESITYDNVGDGVTKSYGKGK